MLQDKTIEKKITNIFWILSCISLLKMKKISIYKSIPQIATYA